MKENKESSENVRGSDLKPNQILRRRTQKQYLAMRYDNYGNVLLYDIEYRQGLQHSKYILGMGSVRVLQILSKGCCRPRGRRSSALFEWWKQLQLFPNFLQKLFSATSIWMGVHSLFIYLLFPGKWSGAYSHTFRDSQEQLPNRPRESGKRGSCFNDMKSSVPAHSETSSLKGLHSLPNCYCLQLCTVVVPDKVMLVAHTGKWQQPTDSILKNVPK